MLFLRDRVKVLGEMYGVAIEIVGEFSEDVSAWKLWKSARPELIKAGRIAREKDAVIVAVHTSRLVRNKRHDRGMSPTVDDFEKLQSLVSGARLATLRYPDYQEDRSGDTVRGFQARNAKPGRPVKKRAGDKKRRRMEFKLPVIRLIKQGGSNREISRRLELPEKTVRDWRHRYRKFWVRHF